MFQWSGLSLTHFWSKYFLIDLCGNFWKRAGKKENKPGASADITDMHWNSLEVSMRLKTSNENQLNKKWTLLNFHTGSCPDVLFIFSVFWKGPPSFQYQKAGFAPVNYTRAIIWYSSFTVTYLVLVVFLSFSNWRENLPNIAHLTVCVVGQKLWSQDDFFFFFWWGRIYCMVCRRAVIARLRPDFLFCVIYFGFIFPVLVIEQHLSRLLTEIEYLVFSLYIRVLTMYFM